MEEAERRLPRRPRRWENNQSSDSNNNNSKTKTFWWSKLYPTTEDNPLQTHIPPVRPLYPGWLTMTKRALVIVADGVEELEAVVCIDVLRRAEIEVTVVGLDGAKAVKCNRGVVIVPDEALDSVKRRIYDLPPTVSFFNLIVFPGGHHSSNAFATSEVIGNILEKVEWLESVTLAASSAAPVALAQHKFRPGAKITSHPTVKDTLLTAGYEYCEGENVVVDDRLITGRGPGTAFEFALKLVEVIAGPAVRDRITPSLML